MLSVQRLVQARSTRLPGGYWLDAQSVEKLTYGRAQELLVLEVIHYF